MVTNETTATKKIFARSYGSVVNDEDLPQVEAILVDEDGEDENETKQRQERDEMVRASTEEALEAISRQSEIEAMVAENARRDAKKKKRRK